MRKLNLAESNIVKIVDDDTVKQLETLLEMAKSGELRGFMSSGILSNGEVTTS